MKSAVRLGWYVVCGCNNTHTGQDAQAVHLPNADEGALRGDVQAPQVEAAAATKSKDNLDSEPN